MAHPLGIPSRSVQLDHFQPCLSRSKHEDFIKKPDSGMSFQKAYDMDTLEPMPEWETAHRKVKSECIELGILIDDH